MKSFFRFVLLALVLLVVALFSALTAMRYAIHGREVAVPDLVGRSPVEARRIAQSRGFELAIERQYYSATVPEGRILSQLPPAGSVVRRGWQLRVAESLGPQRIQIPNVLGQSERAAEMNIQRRGLDISAIAEMLSSTVPADQVLAQNPPPNASGVATPKISLLVAQPGPPRAFVMPSFVGQPLGTAKLILQSSGLRLGTVTGSSTPAPSASASEQQPSPASIIASQTPAPGEKALAGSAIDFVVRRAD
jgi:eukaryotic-like serine/threonine-protein kinase